MDCGGGSSKRGGGERGGGAGNFGVRRCCGYGCENHEDDWPTFHCAVGMWGVEEGEERGGQ